MKILARYYGLHLKSYFCRICYLAKLEWDERAAWLTSLGFLLSGEKTRLSRLKCKYQHNRCFIIATGPSLNKTDLSGLSDEFTFAVKTFLFSGIDRFKIVPNFFCWSDRGTLKSNLKIFPQVNPGRMICFFPFCLRQLILEKLRWRREDIYFINDKYEWCVHLGAFSADADKRLYCSGSVIIDYCIPLAIYMGFNPIYLIGCDQGLNGDVRHYDGRITPLSGLSTPWEITNQAFEVVKKYADSKGIQIYNATEGGQLEVFERVSLKDIVSP